MKILVKLNLQYCMNVLIQEIQEKYQFDCKNKECNILIYLHGDDQWVNDRQKGLKSIENIKKIFI